MKISKKILKLSPDTNGKNSQSVSIPQQKDSFSSGDGWGIKKKENTTSSC